MKFDDILQILTNHVCNIMGSRIKV